MSAHKLIHRDSKALVFAAIASWAISALNSPPELVNPEPAPAAQADLLDAQEAEQTGAWWLDEPATTTKLSFDPEAQRLVWRVSGSEQSVLLDASTGEALSFEFE